jgi:hypothetical protein
MNAPLRVPARTLTLLIPYLLVELLEVGFAEKVELAETKK